MAGIKFKGYVLLESMIAMIIVMMCFGFAVMIYNNIITGSRSKLKVLARICLANEAAKSKSENRLIDETVDYTEFHIEKKIIPFKNSEKLIQLHFTAITPDGIQLDQYNEIIQSP
ncbi:MAG TPA: hypothetical protein VFJ43_05015 [Bacteroidia bacterium]|nr:hypothetical protein [Bacteroidia bacterium]